MSESLLQQKINDKLRNFSYFVFMKFQSNTELLVKYGDSFPIHEHCIVVNKYSVGAVSA